MSPTITLRRIAANHGVSTFQIALAWLLARSPVIVPIPGASKITSAIDSAAAGALELSSDDLAALEQAFPVTQASPSAARAV